MPRNRPPEAGCGELQLKDTSAERIRLRLAERIIAGDLPPGTPLDETQVAAEFAVSRTPVREALRLLAASGLVRQRAHATAIVAKPDDIELAGMFEVMAHLEGLCAAFAARAMSSAERDALDAMHLEMAKVVQAGDTSGYAEANDRFHGAVYAGAHNAYLSEITQSTRQRLQPFRRAQFSALGRLSRSHTEHGAVVDAILRGDAPGAETAMRRHLAIVSDAVQHLGGR